MDKDNNKYLLQQFVDGELGAEEKAEILNRVQSDKVLAKELCELRALKEQVSLAYQAVPERSRKGTGRFSAYWQGVAAVLLLAMGAVFGAFVNQERVPERFVVLDHESRAQAPAVAGTEETRIVFHLTNPDAHASGELLDDIENMLSAYQRDGKLLRVEIIAHGEGLALLRERLSQHKDRIEHLAQVYPNLAFVACQNTITRLRVERGIEVQLVPEAELTRSGVTRVVKRQREGWTYIRV